MVRKIEATELNRALDNGEIHSLYDARSEEDYEARHIAGAESLPVDKAKAGVGLPDEKDARIVFYCADYD